MGLDRRIRLGTLPALGALVVSVLTTLRAHAFFMRPPLVLSLDEAYINAFALRMRDGHFLPFVDAVSHRGPLLYWTAAATTALGPAFSWMPMRLLALSCGLAAIALVYSIGVVSGYRLSAGIAALALPAASLIAMSAPDDGIAFNGEPLLNVFALAAFLLLVLAARRAAQNLSLPLATAAGALSACAILTKQVAVAAVFPLGLYATLIAFQGDGPTPREQKRFIAGFVAGALAPLLITFVIYAAAGQLHAIYYYTVRYNAEIYMAPYHGMRLGNLVWPTVIKYVAIVFVCSLVGGALLGRLFWGDSRGWQRLRAHALELSVGLIALFSLITANAPQRDFGHYYLQIVPWFALAVGILLEREIPDGAPESRRLWFGALVLCPLMLLVWGGWSYREQSFRDEPTILGNWRDASKLSVCQAIQAQSSANDTIFVWGLDAEIYTSCRRNPASRFVLPTFVAGVVPLANAQRVSGPSVPGSAEQLLDDLEKSKPAVIIDAPARLDNRSIRSYPSIWPYIESHYCDHGSVDGFGIFVLKKTDACGPAPSTIGK